MKNIFLSVAIILSSSSALAAEVIEVKILPVEYYLFRPSDVAKSLDKIRPQGKIELEKLKAIAKARQMTIEELETEAKNYKLTYTATKLTVTDYEGNKTPLAALPVSGPNLANVPKEKLRSRPAGHYVQLTFTGTPGQLRSAIDKARTFGIQNKMKLWSTSLYEYSKYPDLSAPRIFLFPAK